MENFTISLNASPGLAVLHTLVLIMFKTLTDAQKEQVVTMLSSASTSASDKNSEEVIEQLNALSIELKKLQ